jgi:glycosyltransferase 2 family protein
MNSVRSPHVRPSTKRRLLIASTYILSIACLLWVLHDINWSEYPDELRGMNWWWVSLAVVTDILVYVWHGWRWSLLLKPIADIPMMRSVRAVYVGLFANEVLPLRAGEVIRCYLQARWSDLPFSVTLSSALIERIFDGIFLVACMFLTVLWVPNLPGYLIDGTMVLAVVVAAGAVLLGVAMFYKQHAHAALSTEKKWHVHMRVLSDDLHAIGHSRYLIYSALATIPYLLTQIVVLYALIRAYDRFGDASWGVATVLMIVLRLGSAVPQAPGNVGTFQALTVLIIAGVFGYDNSTAKRFSMVAWGVVTIPLLVVGFLALAITGAKIRELQHEAKSTMPAEVQRVSLKPDAD